MTTPKQSRVFHHLGNQNVVRDETLSLADAHTLFGILPDDAGSIWNASPNDNTTAIPLSLLSVA